MNVASLPQQSNSNSLKLILYITISIIAMSILIAFAFFEVPRLLASSLAKVNRDSCSCECFDGIMKGPYERGGYKFFYYNAEKETWILCIIAVTSIITVERSFVRIVQLWFKNDLNYFVSFVLLASLVPNYFGIWSVMNFINDQKYHLLKDQLYFTVTEFISYLLLIDYLPKNALQTETTIEFSYYLFTVSIVHTVQSLFAQSFRNIYFFFKFSPLYFLGIRDGILLTVDLLVLFLSLYRIRRLYQKNAATTQRNVYICLGIALAHFILFILAT